MGFFNHIEIKYLFYVFLTEKQMKFEIWDGKENQNLKILCRLIKLQHLTSTTLITFLIIIQKSSLRP